MEGYLSLNYQYTIICVQGEKEHSRVLNPGSRGMRGRGSSSLWSFLLQPQRTALFAWEQAGCKQSQGALSSRPRERNALSEGNQNKATKNEEAQSSTEITHLRRGSGEV